MAKGRKTGGREAGTPNKVTRALKEAILDAAELAGGEASEGNPGGLTGYLQTLATGNPQAFAGLLGKVLPLQITGDPANPLHTIHEVRETVVDPKPSPG